MTMMKRYRVATVLHSGEQWEMVTWASDEDAAVAKAMSELPQPFTLDEQTLLLFVEEFQDA